MQPPLLPRWRKPKLVVRREFRRRMARQERFRTVAKTAVRSRALSPSMPLAVGACQRHDQVASKIGGCGATSQEIRSVENCWLFYLGIS
jgi:hypothetical protein